MATAPEKELTPSDLRHDEPAAARYVGLASLPLAVVAGLVALVSRALDDPVPIWALLGVGAGAVGMLYHAARDDNEQVRRGYGLLGAVLLAISVLVSALGMYWPAGFLALLLGWLFLLNFLRHETDEPWRTAAAATFLGTGAALGLGSFLAGAISSDFLLGPAVLLNLLGLAFLNNYVGKFGAAEGRGRSAAFGVGVAGAAAVLFALARSAAGGADEAGPKALTLAFGLGALFAGGGGLYLLRRGRRPDGDAGAATVVGFGLLALGVSLLSVRIMTAAGAIPVRVEESVFFVPNGLIFLALGLVWVMVSVGYCSDSQFVAMARRELAAYFYSPIAYLVLLGLTAVGALVYYRFLGALIQQIDPSVNAQAAGAVAEPIVRGYILGLLPILAVVFAVPAITMRQFSEERRTGTMEVLLTAPVNEAAVTLSKFLAAWLFFLTLWVPWGLFLVALRAEGGAAFDYRPMLTFYVALAGSGAAFVAVGLFFSSLTRNQIVAAVLTFAVLLISVAIPLILDTGRGAGSADFLRRLSFVTLWTEASAGRLYLRDLVLQVSIAAFFLYLTVKVLESRKWL